MDTTRAITYQSFSALWNPEDGISSRSKRPLPGDLSYPDSGNSRKHTNTREAPGSLVVLPEVKIAQAFINALKSASLDDENLEPHVLDSLRHPIQQILTADDPDLRLSITNFVSLSNASEQAYTDVRKNILQRFPDCEMLSHYMVKKRIEELTGVACVAYTEPYSELEACPECGQSRWDPVRLAESEGSFKIARQVFHTIPLGPQLQALWRSEEGAQSMDYIRAVRDGKEKDMLLMFSIDGAQLYATKESNCWKPVQLDSFLFPGLHHVATLMHDGLPIWDAVDKQLHRSNPFSFLETADGPVMADIDGMTGHMGAYGCRQFCSVKGRRKLGGNHYYPALLKPLDYDVDDHQDRRRETGISKPTIFAGRPPNRILPIPRCFLNVERAIQNLPGCFDKPPRNPAQKINSGYKAQEFVTYLYVFGPALLRNVLPKKYWTHYCKLVRGVRLMWQRNISVQHIILVHKFLCDAVEEFETLYYQRKSSRLHFCRQSIHSLLHTAPETVRVGPSGYRSQWTMERTIGNLGEEIKQHSSPYANLSQRAIRRCQVNALKVMIPGLEPEKGLPLGSEDLGNRVVLLRARDEYHQEQDTVAAEGWKPRVARWARPRLPNGQIIRSVWKESKLKVKKYQATVNSTEQTLALVSLYSPPNADLLQKSSDTVAQCEYFGEESLDVINITQIQAGVGMIPFGEEGTYFVAEKVGLDIASTGGSEEDMEVS
ncbi:hypothetical protein FB451DRAFT_1341823 [Mycena latifolia]|nr:hypothetical protein FB451DRAFT_1341823 [Mycena latifolia]